MANRHLSAGSEPGPRTEPVGEREVATAQPANTSRISRQQHHTIAGSHVDSQDVPDVSTRQVHLWLRADDLSLLRRLAESRGQTLSGAIRYLLRKELRCRT